MGFNGTTETPAPRLTARKEIQQQRFEGVFPRVFAYALAVTGDEEAARSIAVAAFAEAFSLPDMREPDFELELFRIARNLSRTLSRSRSQIDDGLTGRERDVLSLVFDAHLPREQVGSLLSLRPETVLGIVLKGLRKLQDPVPSTAAPPAIPVFYRA